MKQIELPEITVLGTTYRNVVVSVAEYVVGGTALQVYSNTEGPITTPTTNLCEYGLYPSSNNHVFIKNYSEGIGMAEELEKRGLATKTGRVEYFGPWDANAVEMELCEELRK